MPFEVDRREGIRGYAGSLGDQKRYERCKQEREKGGRAKEAAALNDAVFGQVTELHVTKGFPRAYHRDVRAQTLHARDVVTKSKNDRARRQAVSSSC